MTARVLYSCRRDPPTGAKSRQRSARGGLGNAWFRPSLSDVAQRAEAADTVGVEAPETRYARSGDVSIAYQVSGDGPLDLVFVPGFVSHLEVERSVPEFAAALDELSSFSRLIRLDKRGTGMSDRVSGAPTLELRMDDVRAVMDAVGSQRAAFYGLSEGAAMSILFAATYPERTAALVVRMDIRVGCGRLITRGG